MSAPIVVFQSSYGSTRQYAEELAQRLGVVAFDLADAANSENISSTLKANPSAPVVVLSPVHGPANAGAKFILETFKQDELAARRVALCTVGMTVDELAVKKDGSAKSLGNKAQYVQRFYLPGRLNYSNLSTAHRTTMWTVVNMLKAKPMKNANDKMMIDTFDTDVDRINLGQLDQVVEWVKA